jgi:hypothetical protein
VVLPTGDRLKQRAVRLVAQVAVVLLVLTSSISSSTCLADEFRLLDLGGLLATCNRVYIDYTFLLLGCNERSAVLHSQALGLDLVSSSTETRSAAGHII